MRDVRSRVHRASPPVREYIRDRPWKGHESTCAPGKTIGGATVTDDAMLSKALHPRQQGESPA